MGAPPVSRDQIALNLYRQLMRVYVLSGQRTQVVDQYRRCAEIIERELQIEPSQATRDLVRRIRDEQSIN